MVTAMQPIPDYAQKTIEDFKAKIEKIQAEQLNPLRASINSLLSVYGHPAEYDLSNDSTQKRQTSVNSYRADEFYGKPFSTCVREILHARKALDLGPADPRDIFDALRAGGFAFDAADDKAAFRAMQISIGKNSSTFVKLPGGQIGLDEWYDKTRRTKAPTRGNGVLTGTSIESQNWPMPFPNSTDARTVDPDEDSENSDDNAGDLA